ncbi:uncharacterized protein LOC117642635 [Thrips palmi]|uniref:Uncharacterized protein LOC117642635 n=1 Tax=Thrips palmi TaxID=161013 RepID=A0A6P8YJM1_THRPL|nr:uncharacterized protein LOC117642635 [Thrips palmi]
MSAFNVAISIMDPGESRVSIYTMFPYKESGEQKVRCGQGSGQIVLVGQVSAWPSVDPKMVAALDPFPDKVPRNLLGCTIRASLSLGLSVSCTRRSFSIENVHNWTLETYIMKSVFEAAALHWNFTPDISMTPDIPTVPLDNGSYTGRLGMLERGDCDVALAPYDLSPRGASLLQPSYVVNQDSFKVHVRCGVTRAGSDAAVSFLLPGSVVAMLFGGLLLVLAVQFWIIRAGQGDDRRSEFSKLLLDNLSTLTEVPLPKGPSRAALRALLGSWLLFVLNFNVVLKSLLTADTTTVTTASRITSVAELQHTKVTAVGYNSRLLVESVATMGFGGDKSMFCEDDTVALCLDRFESDESFAVIRSVIMPASMKCLGGCHYVVDESVAISSTVFYMRRHDPLGRRLSDTVLALHASGIMNYWHRLHRLSRVRAPSDPAAQPDGAAPLRLAAAAWSAGIAVATVAAVCEVAWRRLQQRRGERGRSTIVVLSGSN